MIEEIVKAASHRLSCGIHALPFDCWLKIPLSFRKNEVASFKNVQEISRRRQAWRLWLKKTIPAVFCRHGCLVKNQDCIFGQIETHTNTKWLLYQNRRFVEVIIEDLIKLDTVSFCKLVANPVQLIYLFVYWSSSFLGTVFSFLYGSENNEISGLACSRLTQQNQLLWIVREGLEISPWVPVFGVGRVIDRYMKWVMVLWIDGFYYPFNNYIKFGSWCCGHDA